MRSGMSYSGLRSLASGSAINLRAAAIATMIVCMFTVSCGGGGQEIPRSPSYPYVSLHIAPVMASVRTGAIAGISGAGNRFVAVATRADGSADVSLNSVSSVAATAWSSSAPNVASIDALGNFTALSPGRTTITATLGPLMASTTLEVSDTAPTLTTVEIYPGLPKVGDNGTTAGIQLQAIAKYDDGSTKNVTSNGAWMSMDVTAAVVDATGMVMYKSTAECEIVFVYGLSYNSMRLRHI